MYTPKKIIDLQAYKNNFEVIKTHAPNSHIMAVLKADAYGHGIKQLALPSLENGASFLGVATVDQALSLRDYLDSQKVQRPCHTQEVTSDKPRIFSWIYNKFDDLQPVIQADIDISVSDLQQLSQITSASAKANKKAYVHIKVDTGMLRAGCNIDQLKLLAQSIQNEPNVELIGIYSHFADADNTDPSFTLKQIEIFEQALKILQEIHCTVQYKHICASSGILKYQQAHYNLVRAGIMLYGLSPNPNTLPAKDYNLSPVMQVTSKIIQVKAVKAGEKVSYGLTYTVPQNGYIAVVPCGYADGIPRVASNKMQVQIKNKLYPQIGRICMDQFMIWLADNPENITSGDEVIIIGKDLPVENLANLAQTINYEIVTKLTGRFQTVLKQAHPTTSEDKND